MNYLGVRLKHLRLQDHLTQQEFANSIGISKSTVSMYEHGNREPDFETLEKIADFFNVDMATLFPENEKRQPLKHEELSPERQQLIEYVRTASDSAVHRLLLIVQAVEGEK